MTEEKGSVAFEMEKVMDEATERYRAFVDGDSNEIDDAIDALASVKYAHDKVSVLAEDEDYANDGSALEYLTELKGLRQKIIERHLRGDKETANVG